MIEILKPTENGLQILDRPQKIMDSCVNPISRDQYLSEILKIKEIDYQDLKKY
jgi:hypothetical protein